MNAKTVYFLMGPTGAGKTALVFELAQKLPIDVISVDSAMIYRGMDIGTAKPTKEEQRLVSHQLIDILDPLQAYSVAQFCDDAARAIEKAQKANKIPLLVGGTMLYFNALKNGLSPMPSGDQKVRERLQKEMDTQGLHALYHRLCELDPSAVRLHSNDTQRILRALEVVETTGKPMSHFWSQKTKSIPFFIKAFALMPENRALLHKNIEKRFFKMLDDGFLDEAKALYNRADLHANLPSMRCVNYRQAWQYFDGQLSLDEMKTKAIVATRQLAKRQITWLRGFSDVVIINDAKNLLKVLETDVRRV